jgi:hypothetical protein
MIAKISQGSGFAGTVNYVMDKKDARLLAGKGVRLKGKASIVKNFISQSKMKPNVSKPVAHISLNFSALDKNRLTDKFMVDVAQEYLEKMGYGNTQYIMVRHFDAGHPHLHLVINRIDNDGNRISDKNEKLRNTKVCRELTEKFSLYISSGKENVNEHRLKEPDKTKYEIYRVLKSAVTKCRNWQDLEAVLRKSEISIELVKNGSTDKIQGVRFGKNGYEFNGSKVDRAFSYSKINNCLQHNEWAMNIQSKPGHENRQDVATGLSSAVGAALSTVGGMFNSPNLSDYDEGYAEHLRQEARRRRKRKKGFRR